MSDGSFVVRGSGPFGAGYRLLASTNPAAPATWFPVLSSNFVGGAFEVRDAQAPSHQGRYYQLVTP
jgi:hypothetical protein